MWSVSCSVTHRTGTQCSTTWRPSFGRSGCERSATSRKRLRRTGTLDERQNQNRAIQIPSRSCSAAHSRKRVLSDGSRSEYGVREQGHGRPIDRLSDARRLHYRHAPSLAMEAWAVARNRHAYNVSHRIESDFAMMIIHLTNRRSQRPHLEIRSVSLSRHPAVAYFGFVR